MGVGGPGGAYHLIGFFCLLSVFFLFLHFVVSCSQSLFLGG